MTNLFIDLYLDEDVSVLVADLVRARGFSALTASRYDIRPMKLCDDFC